MSPHPDFTLALNLSSGWGEHWVGGKHWVGEGACGGGGGGGGGVHWVRMHVGGGVHVPMGPCSAL